uniref:Cobaltochelatase subunit CobN n=1 Tax=Desulfobacca acetoxidans TaxID=60893 RepID=A0A7C5ER45_9BACT
MCRIRRKRQLGRSGRLFLGLGLLCWALLGPVASAADKIQISILLGDLPTKAALEAVQEVYQEYPRLKKRLAFHVYPNLQPQNRPADLGRLKDSRLVFLMIMGRELVEATKSELREVIRKGGLVYCVVGGSYNEEDKALGIRSEPRLQEYFAEGGKENIKNGLLWALKRDLGLPVACQPVAKVPEQGIYERRGKKVYPDFAAFQKAYPAHRPGAPWIGIIFYKSNLVNGQTKPLEALIQSLEEAGFNVLPAYGPIGHDLRKFFLEESATGGSSGAEASGLPSPGRSRVRVIVALGLKIGIVPAQLAPQLQELNVPIIDAISLYSQSREKWERSPIGLDLFERSFQIANPEMAGIIQPTVIASREKRIDPGTGWSYVESEPLPERLQRLVARVKAWVRLQDKPNRDKKIALIYYNYPPGKNNIGASYLNVFPESLWEIFLYLDRQGYETGRQGAHKRGITLSKEQLFEDILQFGRNVGNWAPGELAELVRRGDKVFYPGPSAPAYRRGPILIPLTAYKKWFGQLPTAFRQSVLKSWGPVDQSNIMIWSAADGKKYLVLPAVRYGNLLFTPQPTRGWDQDMAKTYHDVQLAPHHQYIAFYLWLKHGFQADAVVHVGTHGTHEWLPGKETGFTAADAPEVLIQDLPNIYPYIVDDVGEGLQAKRRGMGMIIDYLTPPLAPAGLNKELQELYRLLQDYSVAKEKSGPLADSKLQEIHEQAGKLGLLKDLEKSELKTAADVEELEHHLKEIGEKQTPYGIHTFGRSPAEDLRRSTAAAVVDIDKNLAPEERARRLADLEERLRLSGPRELARLAAALAGRYIPAGPGNDPIRNPDSLPTGKNFYAFDPTRIPSPKIYELGVKLAQELLAAYQAKHGSLPDKLAFNLWAMETIRHEGVMESQIMYLLGIRPKWSERGRVEGVEAIPRAELGRPRLDVVLTPSGLYRDLFPNLMNLLDQAVTLANQQQEADNLLRANILRTRQMLVEKGLAVELAEKLATVRLFTTPPGAYGPNLENVINQSHTWEQDKQVAGVYFMRLSHFYGQGFWGDKVTVPSPKSQKGEDLGLTLFKNALSGSKLALHSMSSNIFATLDNDDFFQDLGGLAMAIRVLDGKSPEIYITNLANPRAPRQETLARVMGQELRARYLNPEWLKAMLKEGYAGARFVDKVVEHLWGWQVTVPEAVDAAKWQQLYETLVVDKNGLDIKKLFRQVQNFWAYQSLLARMLETIRKGYWQPDKAVVETLAKEFADSAQEVGMACCDHTCNNPLLLNFAQAVLLSVPGLASKADALRQALEAVKNPAVAAQKAAAAAKEEKPQGAAPPSQQPPPGEARKEVEGYELQEVRQPGLTSAPIPYLFILGFLGFLFLLRLGWRKAGAIRKR